MNHRPRSRVIAILSALLACALPASHVRADDDPMSDDPAAERRLLQLPDGFDIQLYASEPQVQHPVTINFDSEGRLWALCIPRYPQMLAGQEPADYITILGKADQNGHAEYAHVFAEKLTIPTGMIPGDGGVYVGEGDTLLHFNNDHDKAVDRRTLLTGFGTEDMHHAINTFRWGPDGRLYFDQGLYAKSSVETPRGLRRQFGGCIWQFDPRTLDLEINDRSVQSNNTWGHVFDDFGRSIISSAWKADINYILPDTPLNTSNDPDYAPPLPMTKLAGERNSGLELITGRHFPDDWQHNLVTGGFESQQVYRFAIEDGPDRMTLRELTPLIISHHRKFRPVDMKIGPDGALYISDWYNLIIQHNQVDFRDPRRDHEHGRIWRVTYKNRPLVPIPDLSGSIPAVLDHLKDPEQWTRDHARRVLSERDHQQVATELAKWVATIHNDSETSSGSETAEHDLLEALWLYQTINIPEPALLARVMHSKDARIRAAAVAVIGDWHDRLPDWQSMLSEAAKDENMRVRLNAVLAAQHIPSAAAFDAALDAIDRPADDMVDFELHKAALVLKQYWFPSFQSGKFDDNPRRLALILATVSTRDLVPRMLDLLTIGQLPKNQQAELLTTVIDLGDAKQLGQALRLITQPGRLDNPDQIRLINAISDAATDRKVVAEGDLHDISRFITRDGPLGIAAIRLAGTLKIAQVEDELTKIASNPAKASNHRQAAMQAILHINQNDTAIANLAGPDHPIAIRTDAIIALTQFGSSHAAEIAAQILHEPANADAAKIFNAFIGRSKGPDELAAAMKTASPTSDAARVGLRELTAAGSPSAALMEVLRSSADVAAANRQNSTQEIKSLLALVQSHGDPARGERIFRGTAVGCMRCHAIAGAGGNVGPDLASIGVGAQPDFLLEHILQPNKHVKDGFTAYAVDTTTGDSYTGIQVRETDDTLVLRDALHDQIIIPKKTIKQSRPIGTLMPSGLADNLTDSELADLVRFLSELGKSPRFTISHAAVVRRWLSMDKFTRPNVTEDRVKILADKHLPWSRQYSNVAGELPLKDIPSVRGTTVILRCDLDVTAAGPLIIGLNDPAFMHLWIDGVPTPPDEKIPAQLTVGHHTLDFWLDSKPRKSSGLRCELIIPDGSPARAQWSAN